MSSFRVGQRVACVSHDDRVLGVPYPSVGSVWSVRDVVTCPGTGDVGIRLHGWVSPENKLFGVECILYPHCFRPVVERKTDIGIFKAMLTPSKQKAEA